MNRRKAILDRAFAFTQDVPTQTGGLQGNMAGGNTKTRISRSLDGFDPEALAGKVLRSDAIKLRVTPEMKERIQADAEAVGLSMSELLLGLYEHASPKLRRKRR